MATPRSTNTSPPPQRPRFRLEFRIVHDGLSTRAAQALTAAGSHAHNGQFTLFPNLPPELRLKIWEYLIAPRIVAVACLDAEAPPPEEEPEEPWTSFPELSPSPPSAVPVLLFVNQESRALALKHYEPAFSWKVPHVLLYNNGHDDGGGGGSRWSRPRVWFSFARDAVYLIGELEPCDSYGFNSPTAYFLGREEALRVRRLAVAFAALRYGGSGSQHIFGALFHVVDRFARVAGGKVLVAVAPRDELTHALMGGEGPLVGDGGGGEGGGSGRGFGGGEGRGLVAVDIEEVNVVQKIWRDWYRGSIVSSSLANMQFELVRESDLPEEIWKLGSSATSNP